jgi:hypothetical protein
MYVCMYVCMYVMGRGGTRACQVCMYACVYISCILVQAHRHTHIYTYRRAISTHMAANSRHSAAHKSPKAPISSFSFIHIHTYLHTHIRRCTHAYIQAGHHRTYGRETSAHFCTSIIVSTYAASQEALTQKGTPKGRYVQAANVCWKSWTQT